MASFNKVILIGNLVENPELKVTPSGVPVTNFRIAVGRRFKSKDGQAEADFINIVTWRQTAEFVKQYFEKGKSILVCGSLQSRSWKDNDGNNPLEVVADEVSFVEKKVNNDTGNDNTAPYSDNFSDNFELMTADEDCPF